MAAYIIAFAAVKDRNKLADYSASAGPTIGPAGGALVARTKCFLSPVSGKRTIADDTVQAPMNQFSATEYHKKRGEWTQYFNPIAD